MAIDPTLPKDAASAKALLEALAVKDQDETLCRYPTCDKLRKAAENGGKPPVYCNDPGHTALKNFRARAYIADLAKGLSASLTDTEQPVSSGAVYSLREKTLSELERFSGQLGLYVAVMRELSDPDIASAQIEAAQHRADAQIAAAQETINMERSLRLTAENSRDTAQRDAQAAREEASTAIVKLQESERRAELQKEAYERRIAEKQQEHEQAIERLRAEAQQQIEEIQLQASTDIAQAKEAVALAQEEAQQANTHAHDVETEARARIEGANQRLIEMQQVLTREQNEVEKLRRERDLQADETRKQFQAYRNEIQQLRTELLEMSNQARKRADDDRKEIQQLRETHTRALDRADALAAANDTLRAQLLQIQSAGQDNPGKKE